MDSPLALPSPPYPLVAGGSAADMGMYWQDWWRVRHGMLELSAAQASLRTFLEWSPAICESFCVRQRAIARQAAELRYRRKMLRVWVFYLTAGTL